MRVRTLEIRWHDSKPISTCDFQPVPFKKARPSQDKNFATQTYRLATGGEDNHVRLWMVYPNILPPAVAESASTSTTNTPTPRPPRVEYLATLSRHSAAVNVVRWSPGGDLIASAGDDGMIIVWAPSSNSHSTAYGSDLTAEELQYEKEFWKPRTTFRCTTMQVYDLAWSPTGEYIIAGSTDNAARIFLASDGKCVHEIAEHNHYVQGVAWDPLDEYIATQSSDRSMHIYSIKRTPEGTLEVHAVGKNTKMPHSGARTPRGRSTSRQPTSRPRMFRRESTASDVESVVSEAIKDEPVTPSSSSRQGDTGLLTPSMSIPSTPSASMFPPPSMDRTSSRRSSFSSNAPGSPSTHSRYGRSPSPMPALPAIRTQPLTSWASVKLYGDESFTNFFRRLTFSPDGGLLMTPAGKFEDPFVIPGGSRKNGGEEQPQPARGRKGERSSASELESISSVYIYSRANFAHPPIAQLPGHQKPSVAVRFSPILYELRPKVVGAEQEPKLVIVDKGQDQSVDVNVAGASQTQSRTSTTSPPPPLARKPSVPSLTIPQAVVSPQPQKVSFTTPAVLPSPALSAVDSHSVPTPSSSRRRSKSPTQSPMNDTGSVFALPYRMLYAVATMDTVSIYDTQQASPVCLMTKLHYDEFTDMSWSPDGQSLMLSSRDGYCTIVIFDEIFSAHHTQQQTIQLQSIAQHHSVPLSHSASATPSSTPHVGGSAALPAIAPPASSRKRSEPPLTPAQSGEDLPHQPNIESTRETSESAQATDTSQDPPRKKRRVALTRVGDLDS